MLHLGIESTLYPLVSICNLPNSTSEDIEFVSIIDSISIELIMDNQIINTKSND